MVVGAIFIFLGQAGAWVKGAYDVLLSMGVIAYFIPHLIFTRVDVQAAKQTGEEEVIRVPGGKAVGAAETYTGTVVFRSVLKNGNDTTVAVVFICCASIVNSIRSLAPLCASVVNEF